MDNVLYFGAGLILGYVIGIEYLNRKRNEVYTTLKKILKLQIMSDQNLQELLAKVLNLEQSGIATAESLTNIAADITAIKEGLPATGGLTEEEVSTLRSSLTKAETAITNAKNAAASLDAENPAPTPPVEE